MTTKMINQETQELLDERKWLERVAYSLVRDEDKAKDVAQETYLAALNSAPPEGRLLRAWLGRVATNVVRKNHRGATRRAAREQASGYVHKSPPKLAARLLYEKQAASVLNEAVQRLDEPMRAAVLLRYVDDMTIAQVAAKQGVPVGTADSRIREGLKRLRDDLDTQADGDARPWLMALCPAVDVSETQAASAAAIGKTNIMKPILISAALLTMIVGGYAIVSRSESSAHSTIGSATKTQEETSISLSQALPTKSPEQNPLSNPPVDTVSLPAIYSGGSEQQSSEDLESQFYGVASITSTDADSSWLDAELKSKLHKCTLWMQPTGVPTNSVHELRLTLSRREMLLSATLDVPPEFRDRRISATKLGRNGEFHTVAPSEIYGELKKHRSQNNFVFLLRDNESTFVFGIDPMSEHREWAALRSEESTDLASVTENCLEEELRGAQLGAGESDVERHLTIRLTPTPQAPPVALGAESEAIAEAGPARGTQGAPIVVVAFLDYEDPFSAKALAILDDIEEHYSSQVQIVIRHFPVVTPKSLAAEAAKAAEEQGKFWEMHNLLFANATQHSKEELLTYAQQLDLDLPRFQAALDGRDFQSAIQADQDAGKSLGVSGTPSFFINGELIAGVRPASVFYQLIDRQLGAE